MYAFDCKTEADFKKAFKKLEDQYDRMVFMDYLHVYYNKKFFKKKLKDDVTFYAEDIPYWLGDIQNAMGAWDYKRRHIFVHKNAFKSFALFRTVFLHELCHQAQTDIDHYQLGESSEADHGKSWKKWMKVVGLPAAPEITTYEVIPDDVTEKERAKFMRAINMLNKLHAVRVHPEELKPNDMVVYVDTDKVKLVYSLYVATVYHPGAHSNMMVLVGDRHKEGKFDFQWMNTTIWRLPDKPTPELKKRGKAIMKNMQLEVIRG